MKTLFLLLTVLMPVAASAQVQWRISIKVFTGNNGALPQLPNWGLGGTNLFQELSNGVAFANNVLANSFRGYSWDLTEIVTVPGATAPLPATTNSWFNLIVNAATQDDLDAKAKANAAFQYRNNAINFYYINNNTGPNGGYCTGPAENQHVITIAPNSFSDELIHEAGHFFYLQHTHNTEAYQNQNGSVCTNLVQCSCALLIGGDDNIADTPLDHQCWTRDNVAINAFGGFYTNLNAGQQYFVNNTWLNIMSYHSPGSRFTDDQLDLMTDTSNAARFNVATGRTRFVDRAGNPAAQAGTSRQPFVTVLGGINAAADNDIVIIRPGNYNEPRTYTKPITLRATRGEATIGQ